MNKILVIGHLGRDPEMRYTPNGQRCQLHGVTHLQLLTGGLGIAAVGTSTCLHKNP
jgi:single-stranded DNA-binding protein